MYRSHHQAFQSSLSLSTAMSVLSQHLCGVLNSAADLTAGTATVDGDDGAGTKLNDMYFQMGLR